VTYVMVLLHVKPLIILFLTERESTRNNKQKYILSITMFYGMAHRLLFSSGYIFFNFSQSLVVCNTWRLACSGVEISLSDFRDYHVLDSIITK